jgi:hypothetical protein
MIDAQFHIGKIIDDDDDARRDAVHFALAPVIAAQTLHPGQHIGFVGENEVGPSCDKLLGIVDPFLLGRVSKGQRFWMFLYPNTITSLRHEWSHDAFPVEEAQSEENDNPNFAFSDKLTQDMLVENSIDWLNKFADEVDLSYEELMAAGKDSIEHGGYLIDGEKWEGFYTPSEFWRHYEIVTGNPVEDHDANFFSCSC